MIHTKSKKDHFESVTNIGMINGSDLAFAE